MLFNWVPGILIQLTEGATHVMYYLLKWISALPYSTLSTDRIYLYDFVCYYAMVIVLTNFFIGHAKIKQLRRAIFILFAWASCYSFQSWNSSTQQILVKKTIAGNELFCLVKGKSCIAIRPVPRVKEKWESTLKEIQKYYNTSGFSYVDQEVLSSQSPIDIKKWKGQSNSMFKMGISERLTNYLQAKS
jgi:hypothetical protein